MEILLDNDVERLGLHLGMSRRRLNEQRETAHSAENWLRRLCKLIAAVREGWPDAERYMPTVRMIADAAGVDVAERVPVVALADFATPVRACSEVLRESSQTVDAMLRAGSDERWTPQEAEEICTEADETIAKLHAVKALARERAKLALVKP